MRGRRGHEEEAGPRGAGRPPLCLCCRRLEAGSCTAPHCWGAAGWAGGGKGGKGSQIHRAKGGNHCWLQNNGYESRLGFLKAQRAGG